MKIIIWFVAGLLVGLAFGIVFAPKPIVESKSSTTGIAFRDVGSKPLTSGIMIRDGVYVYGVTRGNAETENNPTSGIMFRDTVFVYDVKRENAEDIVEDINKTTEEKP